MDRFGAKWLFASSVTLYGLGVLLVGFTHTAWYMVCVYGVVVGSATAGSSISLSNALVAQWFPAQRRAFAISVNNARVALGRLLCSRSVFMPSRSMAGVGPISTSARGFSW